jgi:hypothetical protein
MMRPNVTLNYIFNAGDPVYQIATEPPSIVQQDSTTTNVILEPRKRSAADVGGGVAAYCEDDE